MLKGTILVDGQMKTNLPDIYAVGDCAIVKNALTGQPQWSAMGSTANLAARAMAKSLNGIGKGYGGCLGTGVVRLLPTLNGGRTGLTALTTGVLFLACIFIAPIAAIIPAAATSSALIYVGVLMLMGLKNVKFDDMDQMVPVTLMLIGMPISGSIGHAIGLGLISYTVIKVFSGKAKEVSVLTYVISALFLIKFFLIV